MDTNNLKKLMLIGFVANVFEWYDFSIYAYLADVIGAVFFVEKTVQIALIKTFAVFALSYLVRPLGSVFFGCLADHYGRSWSLKTSLLMMAVTTLLLGFLPNYNSAGVFAIIFLLILRMLQGF